MEPAPAPGKLRRGAGASKQGHAPKSFAFDVSAGAAAGGDSQAAAAAGAAAAPAAGARDGARQGAGSAPRRGRSSTPTLQPRASVPKAAAPAATTAAAAAAAGGGGGGIGGEQRALPLPASAAAAAAAAAIGGSGGGNRALPLPASASTPGSAVPSVTFRVPGAESGSVAFLPQQPQQPKTAALPQARGLEGRGWVGHLGTTCSCVDGSLPGCTARPAIVGS